MLSGMHHMPFRSCVTRVRLITAMLGSLLCASLAACFAACGTHPEPMGHIYHVYFLGGQSNMEGGGLISEAGDASAPPAGALIFATPATDDTNPTPASTGWQPVTGGYGWGFHADANDNGAPALADRFGPEVTFAARLRELRPSERVAIIKYAKGGTGIDTIAGRDWGTWMPTDLDANAPSPNQHDHALTTIERALATSNTDIAGDGLPDTLVPAGIVWMQGETDARHEHAAPAYADNLAMLIERLRASLSSDISSDPSGAELPVVIGLITDSARLAGRDPVRAFGETVEQQQRAFVESDANAALMDRTLAYAYSDDLHYDTAGYLEMGRDFAEAMHDLRPAQQRTKD